MTMPAGIVMVVMLCVTTTLMVPATARSTGDGDNGITALIEGFMDKQFPDAQSRFWILEIGREAPSGEFVLDLRAMVVPRERPVLMEQRFLLLLFDGQVRGVQSVPLDDEPRCSSEGEGTKPKEL
jgi:hypothetical protein